MASYSFDSFPVYQSSTGIVANGNINVEAVGSAAGKYTWAKTNPKPGEITHLSLSGVDITSAFINASTGVATKFFTLTTGVELYFTKWYSAGVYGITLSYKTPGGSLTTYPTDSSSGYHSADVSKVFVMFGYMARSNVSSLVTEYSGPHCIIYFESSNYCSVYLGLNAPNSVLNTVWNNTPAAFNDPYMTIPQQDNDGGFGSGVYDGDDIDFPLLPSISAAACGFVGLYNPTLSELKALADYMWTGIFDVATFKKIFGDPMDCILSVGMVPVTPGRSDTKEALKFANVDSGVTAYKVTNQFVEADCGSVPVNGASASAMDYAPYTKAELFLPFCGTHSLSVDEIMDSTISVKYQIDLYTGVCVAHVKISGKTNSDGSTLNSVMYQFTGNALSTIPINSANHAQFIQSALFAAAATAATVASGGAAAAESAAAGEAFGLVSEGGAAISAGSAINTVMASKPDIMKSGNLTSNAGFLGVKYPVLTLTQPNLCRPEEEYKIAGMPVQKSGTLSSFSGFTVVSGCHLDGLLCTDAERDMIQKALFEGVIV